MRGEVKETVNFLLNSNISTEHEPTNGNNTLINFSSLKSDFTELGIVL